MNSKFICLALRKILPITRNLDKISPKIIKRTFAIADQNVLKDGFVKTRDITVYWEQF